MFAEVIVDVLSSEVDKIFDYKIPDSFSLQVGQRVFVPFGNRVIEGYIINIKDTSSLEDDRIKSIIKPLDSEPLILPEMLGLMKFMVERYNLKYVDCMRLFLVGELRNGKVKPLIKTICFLNEEIDLDVYGATLRKNSFNQFELLSYIKEKKKEFQAVLNEKFSQSAVNKLKKDKVLLTTELEIKRSPMQLETEKKDIQLTDAQQKAVDAITASQNDTFLLFGVTGSGKTEVYINVIKQYLNQGKTAIMLVPEIALTPQMLGMLNSRFGKQVAVLHSGLSAGEKFDEWNALLNGEAKVVVGARSAIFAPLKNVGVIVIDEEHESSYISDTNPRYKTVEIAKFRQKFNNCPLILGSATPSIETFYKTKIGQVKLLELTERINKKEMPKIQIVDMLAELHQGNSSIFSRQLIEDMKNCFFQNKQAILFLNRRGYVSFVRCNQCGYIAKCTDCDASLVYHKSEEKLICHYCGKRFKPLDLCPNCHSSYIRQGAVGTQKVVMEIKKIFPEIPIFRMDNDTTRTKNAHQQILQEFSKNKPAILVGTQMIAKGHDFSDVGVVGIIDADQGVFQSDYRSPEKTFQLITQVSGRAGRKDGVGKVDLQTYAPKHFVYKFSANYNYLGFYDKEINIRKTTQFPPFSTILRVLITHENDNTAMMQTKDIFYALKEIREIFGEDIFYFDAMKSPHSKIKNKFRYQVLLRFTKSKECDIIKKIYDIVNGFKKSKCSIFVEIDPQNLG